MIVLQLQEEDLQMLHLWFDKFVGVCIKEMSLSMYGVAWKNS